MSSTITVIKASDPLPEVTVDGPLDGKVFGMNSFYITAKAVVCLLVLVDISTRLHSTISCNESGPLERIV